jgi:hypothetical protein
MGPHGVPLGMAVEAPMAATVMVTSAERTVVSLTTSKAYLDGTA